MNTLTIDQFRKMLDTAFVAMKKKETYFSELDAITGDGDHGTAIVSALSAAIEESKAGGDFKTMFNDMGFGVMLNTSGSTSTLMGGFFLGMSDFSQGTEVNATQLKAMFKGGVEGVSKNTKAVVGDKTMMDALMPAVEAIVACDSEDITEILKSGSEAAHKGAQGTVAMKANFGRARNYGERSIGSVDAGASSWSTMFNAFYEAVK